MDREIDRGQEMRRVKEEMGGQEWKCPTWNTQTDGSRSGEFTEEDVLERGKGKESEQIK